MNEFIVAPGNSKTVLICHKSEPKYIFFQWPAAATLLPVPSGWICRKTRNMIE
jgi:hypothetical protein